MFEAQGPQGKQVRSNAYKKSIFPCNLLQNHLAHIPNLHALVVAIQVKKPFVVFYIKFDKLSKMGIYVTLCDTLGVHMVIFTITDKVVVNFEQGP